MREFLPSPSPSWEGGSPDPPLRVGKPALPRERGMISTDKKLSELHLREGDGGAGARSSGLQTANSNDRSDADLKSAI